MSSGPTRTGRWLPWTVAGTVVLAAGLRWYGLARWSFEQDELYTLLDSAALGRGTGPGIRGRPLYYLLQHLLLQVTPPTEFWLRLPAFVFGVAGVWVTWRVGRRYFGPAAGLVAAFLVAISPWHLYASQFARYWTLVYLLSALALLTLPAAVDRDTPGACRTALLVLLLGSLTHPTFVFPLVGVVLALTLVDPEGRVRWRWPTATAWRWLWGPYLVVVGGGVVLLKAIGSGKALSNWGGRGLGASLRLVPAMVQWATPTMAAAAALGLWALWRWDRARDGRWAAMAALGMGGATLLLLLASLRTDVYADYGMAMLPLLFVSVGGIVQRVAERWPARQTELATGLALVLAAGVLPGTASHLADGTRFNYKAAYAWLLPRDGGAPVVGWPVALQRQYAPQLQFHELGADSVAFHDLLGQERGYWYVASFHRNGLVPDNGTLTPWMNRHCRAERALEAHRLDYRTYRVEVLWCGAGDPPAGGGA